MDSRLRSVLPQDAIHVRTYAELDQYLAAFADGRIPLAILLGRPGTGKTESVKQRVGCDEQEAPHRDSGRHILYVEGHAQPFGVYRQLWEQRDQPVVLDDLDRLYAKPDCVRLLKPLCSGRPVKRIAWYTNATRANGDLPPSFVTKSNVLLIANEWRTLNANVQAIEDRAIILFFDPGNLEVHRRVATWFDDAEVFELVGRHLAGVSAISMRHYEKGRALRRAGVTDWRVRLLQMLLPDKRLAIVAALQNAAELRSEKARVDRFVQMTGQSRPTYFRLKQRLPASDNTAARITLSPNASSLPANNSLRAGVDLDSTSQSR